MAIARIAKRTPKKRGAPKGNANGVGNKARTGYGEKWPPKDYRPEFVQIAIALRDAGSTNLEIAKLFGVDESTLYRWSARYPEFAQALKSGGQLADDRVERALYHSSTGFFYEEEEAKVTKNGVQIVTVRKYKPPSDTAARYWLNNRQRSKWKNQLPEDMAGNEVLIVRGGLPEDHPLAKRKAAAAEEQASEVRTDAKAEGE